MCVYTVTVSKSISPIGLANWYTSRYDDSVASEPKNDGGYWSFDLSVVEDDCDKIEIVMNNDARIRAWSPKE